MLHKILIVSSLILASLLTTSCSRPAFAEVVKSGSIRCGRPVVVQKSVQWYLDDIKYRIEDQLLLLSRRWL